MTMNNKPLWIFVILCLFSLQGMATSSNDRTSSAKGNQPEITKIRYWYRNFESTHSFALLSLALKKTEDIYGKALIISSEELTQGRALALLERESNPYLDIINVVPDGDRVLDLRPVYIAGEEGLVGRRVCIIRKGDEPLFSNIRTLEDIKKAGIIIGQGAHWPDTTILQDNGLDVMTNVSYEGLFRMLEKKRFHCYLRGAHEAFEDLEKHGGSRLTIEPRLVFAYPSASLFFVSKHNVQLATRVELGLRRAILDRDYHALFESNYANYIDRLDLKNRRVIRLNNSLLSDEMINKSTRRELNIDGKIDH